MHQKSASPTGLQALKQPGEGEAREQSPEHLARERSHSERSAENRHLVYLPPEYLGRVVYVSRDPRSHLECSGGYSFYERRAQGDHKRHPYSRKRREKGLAHD